MIERHIAAMRDRPDECWPYPGYINSHTGYGNAYTREHGRIDGHRAAYLLLVGPIEPGMELDHLCRNRACCNPAHLQPVTHRDNLRRGESPAAHQARQTQCIHGHELDGANLWVDRRGRRHCVECRRIRCRESYYRRTGNRPVPGLGRSGRKRKH
jgi:hypothetical protein